MSKEEFLKIQTCVLKVNIHCDGCKQKVKKILQKIDGVYTINIASEQGKVTVSGNVDPSTLIEKLTKRGKHAELWGASKVNSNLQKELDDQLRTLQIEQAKRGNDKGQNQNGGNNQPKGGPPAGQLQQLQQMKGFQDLKMPPQFMKEPLNKEQKQKSVRFNLPEDEDLSDDDYDDDDDDDEYDDEEFDDDLEDAPLNKMKPMVGNGQGGPQMPKMLMSNMMGGTGGGNAKGGGGVGYIPVQMSVGGGNKGSNGNNGNNQNQGGGKGVKNGGGQPQETKNGGGGSGGQSKNAVAGAGSGGSNGVANGNNFMANAGKKGGGMPNMMGMNPGGSMGQMSNLPVRPTGQINNLAAVQGLPTSAMTSAGGGGAGAGAGAGYFQGGPLPEHLVRNPYYQQQLAAMMMNQQLANGNERFQPMMYARPPPAVNYMPPPYPYPYAPPPGERTDHHTMFSDENTSSCSVM